MVHGKMRKMFAGLLVMSMLTCFVTQAETQTADICVQQSDRMPDNPVYDAESDTTDWDYVYFGEYPQTELEASELTTEITQASYDTAGDAVIDGQKYRRVRSSSGHYSSNLTGEGFYDWSGKEYAYFKYEPLRWRVLQVEDDALLLMADEVLDTRKYNYDDSSVTWETASVRNWLNGYEAFAQDKTSFLDTAFTAQEQEDIIVSDVTDSDNLLHGTAGGNATKDRIFFLSIREVLNPAYGFPQDYMLYSRTRMLRPTDYARAMGLWMSTENDLYGEYCWWMLRSPGSHTKASALVYRFGHVYQDGYYTDTPYYGVCPALRVKLSSTQWSVAESEIDKGKNVCSNDITAYGDINGDGTVRLDDAQLLLKMALYITDRSGYETIGDVDGDGELTIQDASYVLKYALKVITRFPIDEPQVSAEPSPGVSAPPVSGSPVSEEPSPTGSSPVLTEVPSSAVPSTVPTEGPSSAAPSPVTIPTPPPDMSYAPSPTLAPLEQKDYDASGRVWIAGDSIAVAYHSTEAMGLCGWGEVLGDYFTDKVTIYNKAIGGRSAKSFTQESNYKDIQKGMQAGDYLLISFGHNDERAAVELYTDPFGSSSTPRSYKWYLKEYYIDPAIRAGVQPVLISPVARRYFYQGKFVNPQLHTPYMKAMEELVDEYAAQGIRVYYVNLHQHMLDLYEQLGEEGTYSLHAKNDTTHLCRKGINIVCDYIVEEMKRQSMNLTTFMK